MTTTLFHPGEREAQAKAGEAQRAALVGRSVSDIIRGPVAAFINKQNMVIVSTRDEQANVWTSILMGNPGFLKAVNQRALQIDLSAMTSNAADPFWQNIHQSPKIGMLFIEPATRRRFRANGTVSVSDVNIEVSVEQAYPNCPKYIRQREIEWVGTTPDPSNPGKQGTALTSGLRAWIRHADTFFVGSSDSDGNLDASHRGGSLGFVQVLNDRTLRIPDYPGNSMFNTLGNFMSNPKAGLLFVDFKKGKTLQLIGKTETLWQEKATEEISLGAMRFWEFYVNKWRLTES